MCKLYVFLIVINASMSLIFGKNKCLGDKYLDLSRNKCRRCPRCPLGTGRGNVQTSNGQDTAENTQCLPCLVCSSGTYNDRRGLTNECRRCTNNKCSNLFRRVEQNCTSTRDFVCGQCQTGYEDIYRNTALACVKIRPKPEVAEQTLTRSSLVETRPTPLPKTEQRIHATIQLTLPLISGILVLILVAVVGIIVCLKFYNKEKCKERAKTIEEGACSHGQSSSTILSTSSEENEPLVEQDGPIEPPNTTKDVRAELQSTEPVLSSAMDGRAVNFNSGDEYHVKYNHFEMKCRCPHRSCGSYCQTTDIDGTIINKGHQLLIEVANSICHDPTLLFRNLGIPDSVVYCLDNDRQRSIHTITQKEFIHSVLRRWTELETTNATVGKLRQALCSARFHRINENVMSKHAFAK